MAAAYVTVVLPCPKTHLKPRANFLLTKRTSPNLFESYILACKFCVLNPEPKKKCQWKTCKIFHCDKALLLGRTMKEEGRRAGIVPGIPPEQLQLPTVLLNLPAHRLITLALCPTYVFPRHRVKEEKNTLPLPHLSIKGDRLKNRWHIGMIWGSELGKVKRVLKRQRGMEKCLKNCKHVCQLLLRMRNRV